MSEAKPVEHPKEAGSEGGSDKYKEVMRYASIFITILIVWVAIVVIASFANSTETTYALYKLTTVFTLALFIFGFTKRK